MQFQTEVQRRTRDAKLKFIVCKKIVFKVLKVENYG